MTVLSTRSLHSLALALAALLPAFPSLAAWPAWPALAMAISSHAAPFLAAVVAHVLHLLPLLGRQLAAKRQQVPRIRLFQLCPGLRHLVDPGQNLGLVRLVVLHQRLKRQLRLFQGSPQIHKRLPMRQQDIVHRLPLCVGQLQPLHDLRIVPPFSLVALPPKRPLKRRPMLSESRSRSRSHSTPAAWRLCASRRAR